MRPPLWTLLVLLTSPLYAQELSTGTLEGTITTRGGKPLPDVFVVATTADASTQTNAQGHFVLALPPGVHTLSLLHAVHGTHEADTPAIHADQTTSMTLALDIPDDAVTAASTADATTVQSTAEAITVTAPFEAFTNTPPAKATITEKLDAAAVARSGDSDAGSALRRVTGLSLVGGRYVYVRGLGERYSSTLVNGATLPSPEPERRVVPMDVFPTTVIESLTIHKTFSPELPGEFGGGTVDIRTRGIPEKFTLRAGASLGMRSGTTFQRGLSYQGGMLDVLGVDDGTRALPSDVRTASDKTPLLERDQFSKRGYTAPQLEVFGKSMPNIWSAQRMVLPPDMGMNVAVGDRFTMGPVVFGFMGAASFDHGFQTVHRQRQYLVLGQAGRQEVGHDYRFETTEHTIGAGSVITLGASFFRDHEVRLTQVINRNTTDETRQYQGLNRDLGSDIRVTRLMWVERTLMAHQVAGTHVFPLLFNAELDWRYTHALAGRYEPDRREVRYDQEQGTNRWLLSDRPEGNQRLYSHLVEHNHDLGLDLRVPVPLWTNATALLKSGAAFNWRARKVDTRRYKFQHKGPLSGDSSIISQSPEEVFSPDHIQPQGFQFEEVTRETDNYTAAQHVVAGYAAVDVPLSPAWKLSAGLRVERGVQSVRTFELFNPTQTPVLAQLSNTDVLPSALIRYNLLENLTVQAAGSVTVSRPDFRELSPATFNDVTGGRQVFGNPDLKRALIGSADLRVEWIPIASSQLTFSLFYKHFINPVEAVVKPGAQQSVSFANAKAADNLGVELEFKTRAGWMFETLEPLFVGGNVALIHSRVQLDAANGIQTSNTRPLQGQSPFVLNLQGGWDDPESGTSVVALYNVFGPRIAEAGALGMPDLYERPFHQVDVVASKRLPVGITVRLKATNLLNLPATFSQGGQVVDRAYLGRAIILGVGL